MHTGWVDNCICEAIFSYLNAELQLLCPKTSTNIQFTVPMRRSFAVSQIGIMAREGPAAADSWHACLLSCPGFSILPFELHTERHQVITQTTAIGDDYNYHKALQIYHRERQNSRLLTVHYFTPSLAFSIHYVVVSAHYTNTAVLSV